MRIDDCLLCKHTALLILLVVAPAILPGIANEAAGRGCESQATTTMSALATRAPLGVDVVAPAPIAKGSDVAPAEAPPPNGDLDPGAALRPPPRVSSALNAPALVNFSVVSTLARLARSAGSARRAAPALATTRYGATTETKVATYMVYLQQL